MRLVLNITQSTGKRAKILIIDDLLKDDTESYNIDLHRKMVDRYDSTWSSRAEDDSLKVYLMGTMWANTDLLNVMYDRATEEDTLVPSKRFKYTEISSKGESVFIGVPALDEKGQSTCPLRYSTEKLLQKKKNMSEFLWQCVYQQDPISPEGMDFDDGNLQHYDQVPDCKEITVYATLDPARKGKNYVSMPIFTQFATDQEKLYVTDWLYQKKSMAELYDEIVERIITNRVNVLYVENNIDVSLAMVLRQKLIERNYYGCDVQERYSYKNKEQRIKDNQGFIRNNIIFPTKGKYTPNSEMGKAMQCLNYFSFEYPNKFDDAPDSIAMMTTEKFSSITKFPDVVAFNRKNLPI